MIDELLKKYNLKYEELTVEEKATFHSMLSALQESQLTMEKLRDYISNMKYAVEQALVDEPEFSYIFIFKVPNRKQIMLKARLKNYMLLEAFLLTPDKAKRALEQSLGNAGVKV